MPAPSEETTHPAPAPPADGSLLPPEIFIQKNSPVNVTLIVLSVLVTVWTNFGEDEARVLPWLISLVPAELPERLAEVRHGEVWRLLTPVFLHGSVAHLGFNMLGMATLGGVLERYIGSRAYLFGTLLIALGSNLGEYFVSGHGYFGGMSGVVYGLFGYVWLRAWVDRTFELSVPRQGIVLSLAWFALCFTGVFGPIANAAHTFGLVLGGLWGVAVGRAAMRHALPPETLPV